MENNKCVKVLKLSKRYRISIHSSIHDYIQKYKINYHNITTKN